MKRSEDFYRELIAEMKRIHHQIPRWLLIILLLLIIVFFAFHAASLLVILILSGVLAYMLSSIINKFESMGFKRNLTVIMLYLCFGGFFIGAEITLSPFLQQETRNFYDKLPEFSKQIETALKQSASDKIKNYPLAEEIIRKILNEVISPGSLISKTLNFSGIFSQAAPFLLGIILVPFFAFFLLKDWPRTLKTIMGWVPPVYVETTVSALSEINILIGKYLRGLVIDCVSVGILAAFGLWLLGINYPISLGILSGAANVIPYFGPVMACIAASLIAFIQFKSIGAIVNIILLYTAIKLTDDLIIQPLTIGKSVKLHPMMLVITIIIGENLFGVMGMILAVPLVTTIQKVFAILLENHRENITRKSFTPVENQIISAYEGNIPL